MKKIYFQTFVLSLAFLVFAADGFGQNALLLVGRDVLGTYQSDQDIYDSLTAWGYAPEFWNSNGEYDEGVGPDFNPLDYGNYDGVFFCETVDSKAIARFASDGYPIPCVNLEGFVVAPTNDRWAWVSDAGTGILQAAEGEATADDKVLVIKDNTHYITQVFDVGEEVTWSSSTVDLGLIRPVSIIQEAITYSAKLGQMKSHASSADFWNLITVDAIGPNDNKMVFWGVNAVGLNGDAATTGSYGTPEFFTIIKRAADWAFRDAGEPNSARPVKLDAMKLMAYPNPASGQVTIRYSLSTGAFTTATLYNMSGQQVDILHQNGVAGSNVMFLDAGQYAAGIYQLRLESEGETACTRVVIQ